MSYFAGHMKKFGRKDIKGIQIHNQREKESLSNRSIDKVRSQQNYDLVNEGKVDYLEEIDRRIEEGVKSKRKIRKDAVLVNSWIITSDKEFFDRIGEKEERRFFEESYKWFADRYGKEKVVYANVHKDEHTPHMHLGIVPITKDGRLSSKELFNRKELRAVQDEFPKYIRKKGFDLERGIPSKEKHMEPVKWKNKQTREEEKRLEKTLGKMSGIIEKANRVIKKGQKEVAVIKTEGKTLLEKNMNLKKENQRLEKALSSLLNVEAKAMNVYSMQESPGGLFDRERVKVNKSDWEELKRQVVNVPRLKGELERANEDREKLHGYLQSMGQEVQRLRDRLQEMDGLEEELKFVESLELKMDLIEEELGYEFDLEFDDEEEMGRKRRGSRRSRGRKARLIKRPRKENALPRHQAKRKAMRERRKNKEQIIDRGRF